MILTILIMLMTLAAVIWLKKKKVRLDKRIIVIAFVLEIAGSIVCAIDAYNDHKAFDGVLYRNPVGEGDHEEELKASYDESTYEVVVEVSERGLDEQSARDHLDKAIAEIEGSFLGENENVNEVYNPVIMREEYVNGIVTCDWTLDSHGVMSPDGTIRFDNLDKPTQVTAYAALSCEDSMSPYEITFTVVPPPIGSEAGFRYELSKLLEKADEESRLSDTMTVPKEMNGKPIVWKEKESHTGEELSLFGIAAFFLLLFGGWEEEKRQRKMRQQELSYDYPDIVSRLSLFVGAGITPKASFERMGNWYSSYLNEPKATVRPGFEAVRVMNRRMADGVSETESYRLFGEDTGHKDYRKLALMLCQNLKKGSRDLIDQLEKEERNAYEDRKQKAKIAGEEASTKLLVPMLMMLGVLLVVLILPSIWGMGL